MNRTFLAGLWASVVMAVGWAGGPAAWESNTFADFLKGRFDGLSLTRDGQLTLAPALQSLASTGETGIWSVVEAADGTLYFATGHRGRVYQIKPGAEAKVIWTSPQPEVFALALDAQGRLYAGTSPDGKIWRIENGKATEYFAPRSRYIWALTVAPDGTLYAGTGDQGQVWRIRAAGQGEVWYETGQANVTALALDAKGRLLAGTDPNGLLYRIDAKDKAFVIYDSTLPEIRSIVSTPDGSLYVGALGGALAQKQAQAAATAAAAQTSTGVVTASVTVSADADASARSGLAAQAGVDLKPKPEAPKPAAGGAETPPAPAALDIAGVEKAAIYRVWPDQTVETLWSSKEENVFDIALRDGEVVFSTDLHGRIYRLSKNLKATLVLETHEGETTRLLPTARGLVAATSNGGQLFRVAQSDSATGRYESSVHDAGAVARWGRLQWRALNGEGRLSFRTRSGNSVRPDRTWSEWSAPLAAVAAIESPAARYIQWQAEMKSGTGPSTLLDSVVVNYQPQNSRPVVRSLQVQPVWNPLAQKASAAAAAPTSYSVTVTDTGDAGPQTSGGTPTQNITRSGVPQLVLTWQADDPENDKLVYSIWFRADDEREWKLIKDNLADNTFTQDQESFADGRYWFRVVASDRPANSPATARESDLVSQPVVIDQTPPRIIVSAPKRSGNEVEIQFRAVDSASPIRRAEYSVNASPWRLLDADDGIADSLEESFTLRFSAGSGETSVMLRAIDSAGNPGLARIVLR